MNRTAWPGKPFGQEPPPMNVFQEAVQRIDRRSPFALAVILRAEGSTPQQAGVRAIIDAAGKITGTLGGGLVEAAAQKQAVEACRLKRPLVFDFRLDNPDAEDAGAVCGGSMRILVDPTAAKHREPYAQAAEALRERRRGVLLTTVRTGARTEVTVEWLPEEAVPSRTGFPDGMTIGACLARETPRLLVEDSLKAETLTAVFVEPVIPKPKLLIAGGGHVGQALAHQAIRLGFDVTVADDRPEFTDPALFPEGVTARCGDIAEQVAAFPMDKDTYVVIVTRGHKQDAAALEACIHAPAAYVGMIGSRRKVELIRRSLLRSGAATEEELNRVFAPVGLDIGAVTVPEIAVSIAAQLIAVRRKGNGCTPPGNMVPP